MLYHAGVAWLLIISGVFGSSDVIRDIRVLKQDHVYYLDKISSSEELAGRDEQKRMDIYFNAMYFSPWTHEKSRYSKTEIEEELKIYRQNTGYGENLRRHSKEWIDSLAENMDLDNFPNGGTRGISLTNTDLRVFPTHRPHFNHCETGQCTYPFDNFQQSAVYVNTPIYLSHWTRDRIWVFVETGYTYGWLPAKDVVQVDDDFIKQWKERRFVVPVKDKLSVYDEKGHHLFNAPVGTLFPDDGSDGKNQKISVAASDENGRAVIKRAIVPSDAVAMKPLPLNRTNMARVANELINEPYGWGGLYRNRDCSAMIMDLFAPFGVWLPRNSRHQALEGGTFIDLREVSAKAKEKMILKDGIPYMTLLWVKGHIMLYMGNYNGQILVFHNFWSARDKKSKRKVSKQIVGHAAVTTLQPGSKSKRRRQERGYLNEIIGMTVIGNKIPQTVDN